MWTSCVEASCLWCVSKLCVKSCQVVCEQAVEEQVV